MNQQVLANARQVIASRGLDGAVITSYTNRRYLTGYSAEDHAPDESSGVLIIGPDVAQLFTSANNTAWAASESPYVEVEAWKRRPWETFVAERMKTLGWKRVGFEDSGMIVSSQKLIAGFDPTLELEPLGSAIDDLRAIKTEQEILTIQRAITLTDKVFETAIETLVAGESEKQIAWRIERVCREETEGTIGFISVCSGPHSARPHHKVGDRQIREGEPIIIDLGVVVDGYTGDLTRTVWVGEPSQKLTEVYDAVLRSHGATIKAIKPGRKTKEVDQITRDSLTADGLKDYIVHAVGHGIGLRVHEAPSISIHSEDTFSPGQVTTVEPGVYLPDWGGVRIEDDVLVTDTGFRVLSAAKKHGGFSL